MDLEFIIYLILAVIIFLGLGVYLNHKEEKKKNTEIKEETINIDNFDHYDDSLWTQEMHVIDEEDEIDFEEDGGY